MADIGLRNCPLAAECLFAIGSAMSGILLL